MPTTILLADLLSAYEWVSAGGFSENSAYISRATGQILWSSDDNDIEEPLPEDIDKPGLYLSVPQKHDLDLGNRLVFRFAEDHLPDLYQDVRDMFRQKGAYSRFKDLLDRQGQLEAWHRYEEQATEAALREWCQGKELTLDQSDTGLLNDPQVQSGYGTANLPDRHASGPVSVSRPY